jgi:hypothetical protein
MHDFFLARLGTVHASEFTYTLKSSRLTNQDHAETSQKYSTFTSKYSQNEYEARLVAATDVSKEPRRLLESEKRYGKTREVWEAAVVSLWDPMHAGLTFAMQGCGRYAE